ncbi:MAG: DNA gyrase C-terminal beta-propeller domain-containing protein, partial [Dehalococcoidia bacterium]
RRLSLKEALQLYIDFRRLVITRRSRYDLKQAQARAHILEGLKKALDNLDQVIRLIRGSKTVEAAREGLRQHFKLSEIQAQAILDMQLRRLAALERQKLNDEYAEVLKTIAYLEDLLANPRKVLFLIREEVAELKDKYGGPRRTLIVGGEVEEFSVEDLVPHEEMVVTVSQRGYVKRVPANTYRLQQRGGRGIMGMGTRDIDGVRHLVVADTHDHIFFFTNRGKVFRLKCYELPAEASRTARGTPIVNVMAMDAQERITTVILANGIGPGVFLIMATCRGEVKKAPAEGFASVRSSGLIAMDLEKGDELVAALFAGDKDDVILVSQKGKAIRFAVATLRSASRTSGGVRGMRLAPDDCVVGMGVVAPEAYLLTITENGFGKLIPLSAYPRQGRGGGGVVTFKITPKTGDLVAAQVVFSSQELVVVTEGGIVLRTPVGGDKSKERITIQGRSSQGVHVKELDPGDRVVSIACYNGQGEKVTGRSKGSDGE